MDSDTKSFLSNVLGGIAANIIFLYVMKLIELWF